MRGLRSHPLRRRSEAPAGERSSDANRPLHVALVVLALFVGSLVVELFPFPEGEGNFRLPALEVELEWDQRQSLALHGTDHFPDLLPMKEKLPGSSRLVIEVARLFVRRYMQVEQKDLTV